MTALHRRPLGFWSLLALGINGVVGVGIFFVPADLARQAPGSQSVVVMALTALLLVPVALSFSTLGGCFDEDGGPVVYARAAFGERAAFAVGWVAYISALASSAAVLVGLTHAVGPSIGVSSAWAERAVASLLCTALTALCALGVSISARVWNILTVLKLLPLLALVGASLLLPPSTPMWTVAQPSASLGALASAGLLATFSFQGFEIVPLVAGQSESGKRVVPLAVLGALLVPALLYVLLQRACVVAVPALGQSEAPLVDAARALGGERFGQLIALGTSVSALGIAVGMLAMTPRYLSSLAAGGSLGFSLETLSAGGVPQRAMLVTWGLVLLLIQLGGRAELFALSSVAVLSQYVVTAVALWALASRGVGGLSRPMRWVAVPAVAVGLALSSGASRRELVVALGALALGFALRALAVRGR